MSQFCFYVHKVLFTLLIILFAPFLDEIMPFLVTCCIVIDGKRPLKRICASDIKVQKSFFCRLNLPVEFFNQVFLVLLFEQVLWLEH